MKNRRSFLKALFAAPVVAAAVPAVVAPVQAIPVMGGELITIPNPLRERGLCGQFGDCIELDGITYPVAAGSRLTFKTTGIGIPRDYDAEARKEAESW